MEFIAKIFDLILLNLILSQLCPDHHHRRIHQCTFLCTLKMVRGEDPYICVTSGNHFVRISSREHLYGYFPFWSLFSWNGFLHYQFTEYIIICSCAYSSLDRMCGCIVCILICIFLLFHILCAQQSRLLKMLFWWHSVICRIHLWCWLLQDFFCSCVPVQTSCLLWL